MPRRNFPRTTNVTHLMKETAKGVATTKCGLSGPKTAKFKVSIWSQDITCTKCIPPKAKA